MIWKILDYICLHYYKYTTQAIQEKNHGDDPYVTIPTR